MNMFMLELPPGPDDSWFRQLRRYVYQPVELLQECAARYGELFTLRLGQAGTLVVVHHPDDVRAVMTAAPAVLRAGESNAIARPIVGANSIFVLDDDAHLERRRLLLPCFRGERLEGSAPLIQQIAATYVDRWRVGQSFSLHRDLYAITLEVILAVVFGLTGDDALPLDRVFRQLFKPAPAIFSFLPKLQTTFPGSPFWFWLRRRHEVVRMIAEVVAQRRASAKLGDRGDVLSTLLSATAKGGTLSDEAIDDELITAVVAGHETTATALAWAFERILCHPEVEARLRDELQHADTEDILRAPLLDATIKEALRQRPPLPLFARGLGEAWQLRDYTLPAGVIVAPCMVLTHMRPDLHEDPECFRPDRWLDAPVDPYRFFPFGGGVRRCLGMAFATLEMKLVIATILQRSRLALRRAGPLPVARRTITLFPKGGTEVVVQEHAAHEPPASGQG